MRARGGGVKSIGMDVGTKGQHDNAKAVEKKNLHRPRVITFNTGGGVVSFKAGGGRTVSTQLPPRSALSPPKTVSTQEPQPSDLYAPKDVERLQTQRARGGGVKGVVMKGGTPATAEKVSDLPGGSGGGKGRLAKKNRY
jgi:hypothetical protein